MNKKILLLLGAGGGHCKSGIHGAGGKLNCEKETTNNIQCGR